MAWTSGLTVLSLATLALHADPLLVVVVLAGGDIVINGVVDDRRDEEPLAIVGGTGAYAGARGTLLVTETRSTTRFRFTFMP